MDSKPSEFEWRGSHIQQEGTSPSAGSIVVGDENNEAGRSASPEPMTNGNGWGASSVSRRGAVAGESDLSIESLQKALEQMSVPSCPDSLRVVIEDTSLEKLVYWKLQALFEKFDQEPPTNVLKTVHEHVERPLFSLVLKKTKGNQSRAAEVLGCNRNTLHRKLKSLAIQPRDVRQALKIQKRKKFRSEMESLVEGH